MTMGNESIISDINLIGKLVLSKSSIVFDFDGVITDSVNVKTEAFYEIYKEYGEEIALRVTHHHKANSGVSRYKKFVHYHKSYLGKQIGRKELDNLCNRFSDLVVNRVIDSKEIKGSTDFLKKLSFEKKKCFINSATPEEEIMTIIRHRNLEKYFKNVYGSPKSKKEILKIIIEENNLEDEAVVMIGDSLSDMEAAEDVGIDFIGIGTDILYILKKSINSHCYLEDFSRIFK